jgi:hypothetical protein
MGMVSCTDYLDKEPDSTVGAEDAFKNFTNFQGFAEEIYNCIPNKESCYWCTSFNWGDDEIMNAGLGDTHVTAHFDLGDYRHWYDEGDKGGQQSWLNRPGSDPTSTDKFKHSLSGHAWYCIRKANLGLENLDKLTDATTEEKRIIKGQLLFFRAWWHHQQMEWWGGIPYVDRVLGADEQLNLPRLSFKECAERCAEDYREAADLLPDNWDNTNVGRKTLGKNDLRITKVCALGYLGKVLLWAASPLNELGAQTGASKNGNTYKYNTELATRAADALAEAIAHIESGSTPFALAEYNYEDIYNHVAAKGSKSNFSDIFRTTGQGWKMPGSVEAILCGPMPDINGSNWNFAKLWGPKVNNLVEHDAIIHMPTANYVNYAYGMENGLPLDDPESGFDPTHPWKNRDPRFYHDIVYDSVKVVEGTIEPESNLYANLYTGGTYRDDTKESRTGYFLYKFIPMLANNYDMGSTYMKLYIDCPYLRLADCYLMYAEAAAAAGGASYKASNCPLTAVQAVNKIRERAGVAEVAAKFTGDNHKFMDEVRRERACELAFEGHRFNDLRRWLLLDKAPYNVKTSQEFTRAGELDPKHPEETLVSGFTEKTILTRNFTQKHWWLPLKKKDTSLYPDMFQNPGW